MAPPTPSPSQQFRSPCWVGASRPFSLGGCAAERQKPRRSRDLQDSVQPVQNPGQLCCAWASCHQQHNHRVGFPLSRQDPQPERFPEPPTAGKAPRPPAPSRLAATPAQAPGDADPHRADECLSHSLEPNSSPHLVPPTPKFLSALQGLPPEPQPQLPPPNQSAA